MWFKVDDKLHDHRKARLAKKAAMGVWVLAGSWCMDNLTDGFVPADVLPRWGTRADARALVAAGLWIEGTREGERGWQFHDWSRFQPTAAVTAATKAAEAEAGVRGNHKRWHRARGITDPDCEYCYQVPDRVPDRAPDSAEPFQPRHSWREADDDSDAVTIGSERRDGHLGVKSVSHAGKSQVTRGLADRVPDREPDRVTRDEPESGGESGANRPVPVPEPHTEPNGSAAALVAEWIERSPSRPPKRVIGQVGRELKVLLTEDRLPIDVVRRGLAAWSRKGAHPSALASFVHEQQPKSAPDELRHLRADEIEQPPDGLTDAEYAEWYAGQQAKRRSP